VNVNVESLQALLEERLRRGRHPWEAAGELRWLKGLERSHGVLSKQTHDEMVEVIDGWLAAEMNFPEDELAGPRMVAEMYARFLEEKVDISSLDPPPWTALDAAWRAWRERAQGEGA
jgi:hypothetical protein